MAKRLDQRKRRVDELMNRDARLTLGAAFEATVQEMGEWTEGEKAAWLSGMRPPAA